MAEIVGGLFLSATASVHETPQHGSLVLTYLGSPIQRLDVFPTAPHVNPFKNVPKTLRGVTLSAGAHQFHGWALNRRWPRLPADNLPVAEPVDVPMHDFARAIAFFFERANIRGTIPPPPHEPRLRV